MQTTIDETTRTFISVAENVVLVRLDSLRALNGDLQALLVVSSTRRIRITEELHRALVIIRERIDLAAESLTEAINGKYSLVFLTALVVVSVFKS